MTGPDQSWRRRAACKGIPLWLFYGSEGERADQTRAREARAIAVCDRCPVADLCLLDDITRTQPSDIVGIRAGRTATARRSYRRRWLDREAAAA
ncbi:WhiB family transcriptional regulator [Nocardiopsis sp. NPDC057823]|uniref:WhiB family transcriptional regulator n=1 Tax=Nocardiopsis sp. NPDC057823 TaxID=3346256 RepID=UPI00366FE200